MDEARAERQLAVIADVMAAAAACGVDVWLRGGWAMDFFLGRVTRDHRDIVGVTVYGAGRTCG